MTGCGEMGWTSYEIRACVAVALACELFHGSLAVDAAVESQVVQIYRVVVQASWGQMISAGSRPQRALCCCTTVDDDIVCNSCPLEKRSCEDDCRPPILAALVKLLPSRLYYEGSLQDVPQLVHLAV